MQRKYSLDFLKLIFITVIVLHHTALLEGRLIRGYIGVEFFFMTSGYFLYNSFLKDTSKTTLNYLKERIKRLYPQYLIAYFILLIGVAFSGHYVYTKKYQFLLEVFMITDVRWCLNYPCWYLTILLICSFVLYGMIRRVPEKFHYCVLGMALFCYIGLSLNGSNIEQWGWGPIYLYLPFVRGAGAISLGMVARMIQDADKFRLCCKYWRYGLEIVLLSTVLVLLFARGNFDFLEVFLIFVLVLCAIRNESILNHVGSLKITQVLIKYEYAIYLNHNLIIRVIKTIFEDRIQNNMTLAIIIFITLIIYSAIFTECIDLLSKYCGKFISIMKNKVRTREYRL